MTEPASLHDSDAREAILNDLSCSMLVEASAGTGKTTSLVGRMCALVRRGAKIDSIVAITFTRKAAAELKGRFFAKLQQLAHEDNLPHADRQNYLTAISEIDRCFIGTIHSACGRFLAERPLQAGIGLNFNEIDDIQDANIRQRAWATFIVETLAEDNNNFLSRTEQLSIGFNDLQSGFERFCQYADVPNWPCDNFDLKPIDELYAAVTKLENYATDIAPLTDKLEIGTDKLITDVYLKLAEQLKNTFIESHADIIDLFENFKPSYTKTLKCWPDKETANLQHENWEKFYANTIQPIIEHFYSCRYTLALEIFNQAKNIYDQMRMSANALNFQDLLIKFRDLLRNDPQQRLYFQNQIQYLLVDEFQDTDPIQAEIMLLLSADSSDCDNWRNCKPAPGKLFVVGDPKQSIYRFRRADIQTYNFVRDRISRSGGKVLSLNVNFRSGEKIIDWINELFAARFPEKPTDSQAAVDYMHAGRISAGSPHRADIEGVFVCSNTASGIQHGEAMKQDSENIAAFISESIASGKTILDFHPDGSSFTRPVRAEDFLVITAKTRQLGDYASTIEARGIAVEVTGGDQLSQVDQLRWLSDIIAAATRHDNPVSLVAYLRGGMEGFSDQDLVTFKRCDGKFDYLQPLPDKLPEELSHRIKDAFDRLKRCRNILANSPDMSTALENIYELCGLQLSCVVSKDAADIKLGALLKLTELCGLPDMADSPSQLLSLLNDILSSQLKLESASIKPSGSSAVRVMNLHKSKGLEAPVVILAYPRGKKDSPPDLHVNRGQSTDGNMSINATGFIDGVQGKLLACSSKWQQDSQAEKIFLDNEYLRLMYVAATRAGQALIVSTNTKKFSSDPWAVFYDALQDMPDIDIFYNALTPVDQIHSHDKTENAYSQEIAESIKTLTERKQKLLRPTYRIEAAKQSSLNKTLAPADYEGRDTLGTNWGLAVHKMLELLAKNTSADIAGNAKNCCELYGLPDELSAELAAEASAVSQHSIWKRAIASEKFISEVPFEVFDESVSDSHHCPTIVRGVIDLVFKEKSGWVIVDYKTDIAAQNTQQARKLFAYYKAQIENYCKHFERFTGENVCESGILFTASGEYFTV